MPRKKSTSQSADNLERLQKEEQNSTPALTSSRKRKIRGNEKSKQQELNNPSKRIKKARSTLPLKGMTIAVSAHQKSSPGECDNNNKNSSTTTSSTSSLPSYNTICSLCNELGATITSQVHKRVTCVIATQTAIKQNTQRIRKAIKFNIPIVSVEWLIQCKIQKQRLQFEKSYILRVSSVPVVSTTRIEKKERGKLSTSSSSPATETTTSSSSRRRSSSDSSHVDTNDEKKKKNHSPSYYDDGEQVQDDDSVEDGIIIVAGPPNEGQEEVVEQDGNSMISSSGGGWTEPVSYGCCCICHDNDTTKDCEWCQNSPCSN